MSEQSPEKTDNAGEQQAPAQPATQTTTTTGPDGGTQTTTAPATPEGGE